MFALVVAVFEEVAAVAFFFAFVVVVVFVADVFFFADWVEVFEVAVAALSFLSLNEVFVVFFAVFAVSTTAALSFFSLKADADVVTALRRSVAVALFLFWSDEAALWLLFVYLF